MTDAQVALCDLPAMMAEHDRAHRAEIEAWLEGRVQERRAIVTPG